MKKQGRRKSEAQPVPEENIEAETEPAPEKEAEAESESGLKTEGEAASLRRGSTSLVSIDEYTAGVHMVLSKRPRI